MQTAQALSIQEFVKSLSTSGSRREGDLERRLEPRYAVALVVDVLPLNVRGIPCGSRRKAVTRDLSAHGIGLFADIPFETKYLRLWLPIGPEGQVEVLAEVLRCEPFAFMFNIGGRFVADTQPEFRPLPVSSADDE